MQRAHLTSVRIPTIGDVRLQPPVFGDKIKRTSTLQSLRDPLRPLSHIELSDSSRCWFSYSSSFGSELVDAMLYAFTARSIIELRQRDKSKIETILAYGTRFLFCSHRLTDIFSQVTEFSSASTAAPCASIVSTNSPRNPPTISNTPEVLLTMATDQHPARTSPATCCVKSKSSPPARSSSSPSLRRQTP